MNTLVIVESACVGAAYTANAAKQLGYRPLYLADGHNSQGETLTQMKQFDLLMCDTNSVTAMEIALKKTDVADIKAVISLCDTSIMNAIELAERLGVKSIHSIAKRLKDKGEVFALIPEFSPPSIVFDKNNIPFGELKTLAITSEKILFKACCSSGGYGSFTLNKNELDQLPKKLEIANIPVHLKPEKWIAQSFIEGRLVSLEGYISNKTPFFIGFTGRKKIGMTESVVIFPVDNELNTTVREKIKNSVTCLLQRSGFKYGYFHVEFIVTSEDAFLIDANIGRIGGAGISEQFAIAYDTEPTMIYRHILLLSLEQRDENGSQIFKKPMKNTWSAAYGIPIEATLKRVILPKNFPNYHIQILDNDTIVPTMGTDNYAWVGIVSGEARSVEKYTPLIKIETDKGTFNAIF